MALGAKRCLATILIEQAKLRTERARATSPASLERQRMLGEARTLLGQAEQSLQAIDVGLTKKLKGIRIVKDNDARLIEQRDRRGAT